MTEKKRKAHPKQANGKSMSPLYDPPTLNLSEAEAEASKERVEKLVKTLAQEAAAKGRKL